MKSVHCPPALFDHFMWRKQVSMRIFQSKLSKPLRGENLLLKTSLCVFLRLVGIIGEVMSPILFYQLLCCAVDIAVVLVAVDMHQLLRLGTLVSIEGVSCMLFQTFFFCKLSESITSKLYSIGDIFYEANWYTLPVRQQKWLILPIQRSQREFRLKGFGIIDCSLWIFLSVSIL